MLRTILTNISLTLLSVLLSCFLCSQFYPVFPVQCLFFVPWLWVLERNDNAWRRLFYAAIFGLSFSNSLFYRAIHYGWSVYFAATIFFALPFVIFGFAVDLLERAKIKSSLRPIAYASAYSLIEILLGRIEGFPFGNIGAVFVSDPCIRSLAAYAGAAALSWLVLFANTLVLETGVAFSRKVEKEKMRPYALQWSSLSLLFAALAVSFTARRGTEAASTTANAAIIQGSIPSEDFGQFRQHEEIRDRIIKRYLDLSERAVRRGAKILFWPEGTFNLLDETANEKLRVFVRANHIELIGGFIRLGVGGVTNSAVAIDASGNDASHYDKTHMVPIVEDWLHPGKHLALLSSSLGRLATPICLESFSSRYVRKLVDAGADAIVTITDEAGYSTPLLSRIILNQTVLRAVENGRTLIRVSQDGYSAVVSPNGTIISRAGFRTQEAFMFNLKLEMQHYSAFLIYDEIPILIISVISLFAALQITLTDSKRSKE